MIKYILGVIKMKLRELKCKNCGAVINVEENASKVECEYCHTSFAVDDAYSDGYKFEKGRMKAHSEQFEKNMENAKTVFKPIGKVFVAHYIVTAVIGVIIFLVAIGFIIFMITKQVSSTSEFDVNRFNSFYEMHNGSEFGMSVKSLIYEVSTNNKKDKEHQITVKYGDINTKEPEKMIEIKKEILDTKDYEVSLEYDDDGFVYMVTIEDFE